MAKVAATGAVVQSTAAQVGWPFESVPAATGPKSRPASVWVIALPPTSVCRLVSVTVSVMVWPAIESWFEMWVATCGA